MIRMPDKARSIACHDPAFGLRVADRLPIHGFTLICLRIAEPDFEVELTINAGRTGPYDIGHG